jgi:hypothetical protein
MPTKTQTTSGSLAAGAAALMAPAYAECSLLIIANNGTNPMVYKFGSAPANITDGIPLDPASVSGGQGGVLVLTGDDACADAIYGMSASGTTFSVQQGTSHS